MYGDMSLTITSSMLGYLSGLICLIVGLNLLVYTLSCKDSKGDKVYQNLLLTLISLMCIFEVFLSAILVFLSDYKEVVGIARVLVIASFIVKFGVGVFTRYWYKGNTLFNEDSV